LKIIPSALILQKNKLNISDPYAHLFIIQINDTDALYLTNHSEKIAYDGHEYSPFPIQIGESKENSRGNLETLTLTVSNIDRSVMAYLELNDALLGNEVRIYLVNRIDTTQAIDLGNYQIVEVTADQELANITLGHYNFFGLKFPRNRFIKGRCRWVYRSPECGYSDGLPSCDKTLDESNGCRVHSNTARFGGFPGIPAGRFVTR